MPLRVRNAVLMYLLFVAWGVFLFAYPRDAGSGGELLGIAMLSIWAGGVYALPLLLAAWASLSDQPLVVRLPNSVGLLATYSISAACGVTELAGGQAFASVLTFFGTTFLFSLCVLLAVRLRWSIESSNQTVSDRPVQFTVRRALMWTLAVGVLFGAARMLLPEWPPQLPIAPTWKSLVTYPLQVSILGSAMLLVAIGFVLGDRHRLRYGIGLLVLAGVAANAVANFRQSGAGASSEMVAYAFGIVTAFAASTIGTLWVCRIVGYRLTSRRT